MEGVIFLLYEIVSSAKCRDTEVCWIVIVPICLHWDPRAPNPPSLYGSGGREGVGPKGGGMSLGQGK